MLKANQDLVEYANTLKKNGVSFLGDAGAFLFKNQMDSLVEYESSLPTEFDIDLKGICLYHQKDFEKLSKAQKDQITKHYLINSDNYEDLTQSQLNGDNNNICRCLK